MPSAVLTTKGQITIPVEIRKELGLRRGDRLQFTRNPKTGGFEFVKKTGSIMALKGIVKYDGPPVSVEQMRADVGRHLAEDDARIRREYRRGR